MVDFKNFADNLTKNSLLMGFLCLWLIGGFHLLIFMLALVFTFGVVMFVQPILVSGNDSVSNMFFLIFLFLFEFIALPVIYGVLWFYLQKLFFKLGFNLSKESR